MVKWMTDERAQEADAKQEITVAQSARNRVLRAAGGGPPEPDKLLKRLQVFGSKLRCEPQVPQAGTTLKLRYRPEDTPLRQSRQVRGPA